MDTKKTVKAENRKELMKLVLEKRIAHGSHPVLRWNVDNICIRTDSASNIKADKEKSTEKIDGSVATIMALARAIRCGNDSSDSVYDSREMLVIKCAFIIPMQYKNVLLSCHYFCD